MCPNSNDSLDVPDQYLSLKSLEKYRRYQHQIFTVICCNIRVYGVVLHQINIASCVSSRIQLGHIYI